MEILQIVTIGIVSTVLVVLLRQWDRPEFAIIVSIVTGIFIISMLLDKLKYIIDTLSQLIRYTNMESAYFTIVLKIIGIAYIVEFGAEISRDAGEEAIASKVELGGKIIIMVLAMPILLALIDLIIKILP
ncbi:stage III sporulation protein AD [Keratinibaculum paraultunense]|uniref:Stage III sporulation protein AD n=1 Tax=Keratinibaculum paraultunense TaxID=1278232 RepID=A0A4R3KZT0_9FIRM|nr:stage III sporulation protein AD [Keratinibaculum paraultunense]QQY80609.1 stage III sporulation protein AD [Keratinibaculum paraultunense]TCS91339.1 stage III sporulation protein AD [Keratinibaculum paraultunense]